MSQPLNVSIGTNSFGIAPIGTDVNVPIKMTSQVVSDISTEHPVFRGGLTPPDKGPVPAVDPSRVLSPEQSAVFGATVRAALAENSDGEPEGELYRTFTDQAVALIGSPTSDGRMLSSEIDLSFRSFPLPLMWCKQSKPGHMDSFTVGVIETASVKGTNVIASGYLLNTAEADEAALEIAHGVSNPSVDLAAVEWSYTDEDGKELSWDEMWDIEDEGGQVYMTFTKAELIGTTLVSTPAFDTKIALDSERSSRTPALVASAAEEFRPKVYDHRLFEDPKLSGPTLPTMGEDGRIYGHLALFGECHRSIQDSCTLVPRSPTQYSQFHTSPAVRLDNGSRLPVGRLTVGIGHADPRLRGAPAMAHYDNVDNCFALVRVGEDKHGIWFSGVAAPWATPEVIAKGLAAPLSGDWRDFGQGLDLVAALAVNTPGFNVRGLGDEQGRPIALVAAGRVSPRTRRGGLTMSRDELKAVVKQALAEQEAASKHAERRDQALARAANVSKPKTARQRIGDLLAARAG